MVRPLVYGVNRTRSSALTEKVLSHLVELLAIKATWEQTSCLPPRPSGTCGRKSSLDPSGGSLKEKLFSMCLLSRQGGLLISVY